MTAIAPLQFDVHAKIKINDADMSHVATQHMVPLLLHEFTTAAAHFPVVFVKNSQTGQFQAICMLGVKTKQNLFVNNNLWVGGYLPASIQNSPLCLLTQDETTEQFLIGVDETSLRVGLDQGHSLFEDGGEETDYFKQRKAALVDYFEKEHTSQAITQFFVDLQLLKEERFSVKIHEETLQFDGIYIFDELALNTLSAEKFLDLRTKGLLPIIYSQMFSLQQLNKLIALAA